MIIIFTPLKSFQLYLSSVTRMITSNKSRAVFDIDNTNLKSNMLPVVVYVRQMFARHCLVVRESTER